MISIPIVAIGVLALCSVNFFLLRASFYEIYVRCMYSKRKRKIRDQDRNPYIPKDVIPENLDREALGAYDSEPDEHNEGFEMVSVDHDDMSGNLDALDSRSPQPKPSLLRRLLGIT